MRQAYGRIEAMFNSTRSHRKTLIHIALAHSVLALLLVGDPSRVSAQPRPSEPPVTYEVQIDGESFQVQGNQRPTKVESKVKKGTTYELAIRVARNQHLRLNSVQLEYGMPAKATDDKGRELRIAQIVHDLGFSLALTDMGSLLDDKHQDELLKAVADDAVRRYTDRKAVKISQTDPKVIKFGSSDGKWLRINYTDAEGAARSCMIFVLFGKAYTVSAIAEFRDQDKDDALAWVKKALESIRPLE
jgi:hypothetical protein